MAESKLMIGKKEVKIFIKTNTALYIMSFTSGGELPSELRGSYTSPILATDAVLQYNKVKAK